MAEVNVNTRLSDQWQAFLAGTEPAGYVYPKAIIALAEIGIQYEVFSIASLYSCVVKN